MQPATPWQFVQLVGDGDIRCATLVLPTPQVRALLPWGLDLEPQTLTPPGTHPVVMFFQDMLRAHMTVPTLLPSMSYHEQVVGIPFVRCQTVAGPVPGPFFYMPNLFLDDWLAILGGRLYWGFAKQYAQYEVTRGRYAARDAYGPLVALDHEPTGRWRPASEMPNFEPWCRPRTGIMCQPLIAMLPMGMGPLFVASDFEKHWPSAQVRPLTTRVHIHRSFVPALPTGAFPRHGPAPGLDRTVVGSFQVRARWRLTLPYLPEWGC